MSEPTLKKKEYYDRKFTPPQLEGCVTVEYRYTCNPNGTATESFRTLGGYSVSRAVPKEREPRVPLMIMPDGSTREADSFTLKWERSHQGYHLLEETWHAKISANVSVTCRIISFNKPGASASWEYYDSCRRTKRIITTDAGEAFEEYDAKDKHLIRRTSNRIPSEYRLQHPHVDAKRGFFDGFFQENWERDADGNLIHRWNSEGEHDIRVYEGGVLIKRTCSLEYSGVKKEFFYENGKVVHTQLIPESVNVRFCYEYPWPNR